MRHLVMLLGLTGIALTLVFGIQRKQNSSVSKIQVSILPLPENKYLIDSEEIYELLKNSLSFDIDRAQLKDFDISKIERQLKQDQRIDNAQVFFGKNSKLFIHIIQKNPIMRVSDVNGDFYLDNMGDKIDVKLAGTIRVPVVTGIKSTYVEGFEDELNHDLADAFHVAKELFYDEFLHALVEQIHVGPDGELTLVPKLGESKIMFGTAEHMDEKFDKLKLYYKDGIKQVGLERYAAIDLSYENQIVGKLR